MTNPIIEAILVALNDSTQLPAMANLAISVEEFNDQQVDQLIGQISDFGDELQESELKPTGNSDSGSRLDHILQPIVHHLAIREAKKLNSGPEAGPPNQWSDHRLRSLETLYQLTPASSDLRNHLLRWLATSPTVDARELWTDLICDDPPEHRLGIILAFSPLMQASYCPSETMLSRLLNEATSHSQIAPAVFDLFNYYFRQQRLDVHPAESRSAQLIELLGQLVGQLGRVEEGDFPAQFDARQINQLVSDSVALIVALCDTFSLMENQTAIPKLHQALQLRHRRVQTEAAAALARLGDEAGKMALIAMADQPISRLRVLAYADELGFQNEISLELQGEIAIAESQLAIWLSEPDQMGLAPSSIELIDNQEMYWPSYDHPVQCYLFRYTYGSGETAHSNIGICGPLVHAFAADLRHLPTDEIYATFAGWQTIHKEIFQISPAKAQQAFGNELRRLQGAILNENLDELKIQTIGSFFGELVLVATAKSESQTGTVVVDSHDSTWFELGNPEAPIDWKLAYAMWRGKQLLTKFNSSERM